MNEKQLIKKLKEIQNGIESDNFTWENIYYLIEEIEKKGLKESEKNK